MMSQHPALKAMYKQLTTADLEYARYQVRYWEDQLRYAEHLIVTYHRQLPTVTVDNREKVRRELDKLNDDYNSAVEAIAHWQHVKEELRIKLEDSEGISL
jgi:uncharacterized protein (DUF3084 family)